MNKLYAELLPLFWDLEPTHYFGYEGGRVLKISLIYSHPSGHYMLSVKYGAIEWRLILENGRYSLANDPDRNEILEAACMDCHEFLNLEEPLRSPNPTVK